jgi:hypothetical protein
MHSTPRTVLKSTQSTSPPLMTEPSSSWTYNIRYKESGTRNIRVPFFYSREWDGCLAISIEDDSLSIVQPGLGEFSAREILASGMVVLQFRPGIIPTHFLQSNEKIFSFFEKMVVLSSCNLSRNVL